VSIELALRHSFGGFSLDVAFTAPTPGVTALFGASGAGKSTVLAAVAGLQHMQHGRIVFDGTVLFDSERNIRVPAERRRCGVVFQDARLFPHMSVKSNLEYGRRRTRGEGGPGFAEVVALLGLEALLDRRPTRLSGGERQRVALGRALLARPQLLLMDEPLAALDAPRKAEILPFLERLRDVAGVPILYVTHSLDEVDRLADTLVVLQQGRVVAAGPVEELSARTDLPALADRNDSGALLRCRVDAHDGARGQTRLAFDGGELVVPLLGDPVGSELRIRLRARDVAIAMVEPVGLSIRNRLAAVVERIDAHGPHEVFVTLRTGNAVLLSRIARETVGSLQLAPGNAVWALVKSIALGPVSRG
jgi:molybdate transport system ATP-binding protein